MAPRTEPRRAHVIAKPSQLRALRTPTRHRVLNAILELGPCSVGDLAERLEWKAESLYYHVKALRKAGLVVDAGNRPGARRAEALYSAVAADIVLDAGNRSSRYLDAVWDTYRAALRVCERALERALHGERGGDGPREDSMLQQLTVRLRPAKAKQLRKMLDDVARFASEHEVRDASEPTEAVCLTLVLSKERRG